MNTSKQRNKALTVGRILAIVSNVIFIGFIIIKIILSILELSNSGPGSIQKIMISMIIFVFFIFMMASIVILIFTVRFFKWKSGKKTAIGIVNLVFAILIAMILPIWGSTWDIAVWIAIGITAGLMGLTAGILILVGK